MKVRILSSMGSFATNCYIVSNNNEAVAIDAPCNAEYIYRKVTDDGLKLSAILLTHGHLDHIAAVSELVKLTGCKVYIHALDASKLCDDYLNLSEYFGFREGIEHFADAISVHDGDKIKEIGLEFEVIHTPGHTSGSVCFRIDDILFTGDTLFESSIGRTDMPDGNSSALTRSLELISAFDKNYKIYAGHGGLTDLETEKMTNHYLGASFYDINF